MKAYFLTPGPGGTEVELRETATPEPKPGELLVRVRATSLNRGELLGGKPGAPARAGGGECAGDVVKLGDGVTAVSTGALDDAESIQILQTLVKQRKESIEQFTKGNRPELAGKETKELAIIESYLPAGASEAEMDAAIAKAI